VNPYLSHEVFFSSGEARHDDRFSCRGALQDGALDTEPACEAGTEGQTECNKGETSRLELHGADNAQHRKGIHRKHNYCDNKGQFG
jgi:hypothetical protein